MGNGGSKISSASSSEGKRSRRARFKERLHLGHYLHRDRRRKNGGAGDGSSGSSSSALKLISAENFAGIALLTLIRVRSLSWSIYLSEFQLCSVFYFYNFVIVILSINVEELKWKKFLYTCIALN